MENKLPHSVSLIIIFYVWLVFANNLFAEQNQSALLFMENKGQVLDLNQKNLTDVKFTFSSNGTKLFIRNNGITYQFLNPVESNKMEVHRMDMELVGANSPSEILKENESNYYENYYLSGARIEHVRGYSKLIFKNVYPKIDWVIYANNAVLEYDFLVHPGGNPSQIKLEYHFADKLNLNEDGSLTMNSRIGKLTEGKPESWTEPNHRSLESNFILNNNTIQFQLGDYDASQTLVIDPTLVWSRYSGGNLAESVTKVTENMAFGYTSSTFGVATTGGFQTVFGGTRDAFYSYFDNSGTILFSTYFGGSESDEALSGLFVSDGSFSKAVMVGKTNSTAGIAQAGLVSYASLSGSTDGFIAVFLANGTLQFSSYFGGNAADYISDVKQLGAANDYTQLLLSGVTSSSSGFSNSNSYQGGDDAFIAKLSLNGGNITVNKFAYFGGLSNDFSNTLSIYKNRFYSLSGNTESASGIATSGAFDVALGGPDDDFVAQFDTALNVSWASYYGGNASEKTGSSTNGSYCAFDTSGFIYLLGNSTSGGLATSGAHDISISGLEDFFLAKFDSTGTRMWATYFGGFLSDIASAIAINNNNLILLGGYSNSPFMDIDGIGFVSLSHNNNDVDAVAVEFTTSGQFIWSSPLGSSLGNEAFNSVAFSSNTIVAGGTTNSAFGLAYNSSSSYTGGTDGLIARLNDRAIVTNAISNSSLCPGDSVLVSYTAIGNFPANTIYRAELYTNFAVTNPVILGTNTTGSGLIRGYIPINTTASFSGNTIKVVTNLPANPPIASSSQTVGAIGSLPNARIFPLTSTTICEGSSVVLKSPSNTNIVFRQWQEFKNSNWLNIAGANSISYAADSAGTYRVITTSVTGCDSISNSILVTVQSIPSANILASSQLFCLGNNLVLYANTGAGLSYQWFNNSTLLANRNNDTLQVNTSGNYTVRVTNSAGCSTTSSGFIVTGLIKPPAQIVALGNTQICMGQSTILSANNSPGVSYQWYKNDTLLPGATLRTFTASSTGNYYVHELNTNNCDSTSNTIHLDVFEYPNPTLTYNGIPYTCLGSNLNLYTPSQANYSYQWIFDGLPISGAVDTNYVATASGNYSVIVTNQGICSDTSTTLEINPAPEETQICYASIDTAYGGIVVAKLFWQKPMQDFIQGYIIYREIAGQGFVAIDTVSNALFSAYIDSTSHPETTVERYKIATLDSCGTANNIGATNLHQTILLQGALDPTNSYIGWDWEPYLGINDPSRYYRVMRDTYGNGIWDSIKSTPWSVTSWNDTAINYANAKYAVELVWQEECTPSQRTMAGYSTSRSNIKNRTAIPVGLQNEMHSAKLMVYPNPAQKTVTVEFVIKEKNALLYLQDMLGRIVFEKVLTEINGPVNVQLNLENVVPGVYHLNLKSENTISIMKLSITK